MNARDRARNIMVMYKQKVRGKLISNGDDIYEGFCNTSEKILKKYKEEGLLHEYEISPFNGSRLTNKGQRYLGDVYLTMRNGEDKIGFQIWGTEHQEYLI